MPCLRPFLSFWLLVSELFLSIWFQDLLFLACSHPENRSSLTKMEEWPEWILEVLISNYEVYSPYNIGCFCYTFHFLFCKMWGKTGHIILIGSRSAMLFNWKTVLARSDALGLLVFLFQLHCLFLQMATNKDSTSSNFGDVEDLIHNFLIIILEHSMRQKDGWKVNFSTVLHFL